MDAFNDRQRRRFHLDDADRILHNLDALRDPATRGQSVREHGIRFTERPASSNDLIAGGHVEANPRTNPLPAHGEAPAHAPPDGVPTPNEFLALARADRDARVQGLDPRDHSGSWRSQVDDDTAFYRVISPEEYQKLQRDGVVMSSGMEDVMGMEAGADRTRAMGEHLAANHQRGDDGQLAPRAERGANSGGSGGAINASAWAPASSVDTAGAVARGEYIVRFRRGVVGRTASANNSVRECEYTVPLYYTRDDVEWIADPRANRWVDGHP